MEIVKIIEIMIFKLADFDVLNGLLWVEPKLTDSYSTEYTTVHYLNFGLTRRGFQWLNWIS